VFGELHFGDILIKFGGLQWGNILLLIMREPDEKHTVQCGIYTEAQGFI